MAGETAAEHPPEHTPEHPSRLDQVQHASARPAAMTPNTTTPATAIGGGDAGGALGRDRESLLRRRPSPPYLSSAAAAAVSRADRVVARCKACAADFGTFANRWVRVTGSYYLLAHPPALSTRTAALQAKSKPKPASDQSSLSGCTIQPLVCGRCDETLGLFCLKAPDSKTTFNQREFFKLPKIQLRAEANGRPIDPVIEGEHQDAQPKLPSVKDIPTSPRGPPPGSLSALHKQDMVLGSLLSQRSAENIRHHDTVKPSPSNLQHQAPKMSTQEQYRQLAGAGDRSHGSANGHPMTANSGPITYPSSLAVKLDAIDRLQIQVNLNRATLESCTRDISRLEESIRLVHGEFKQSLDAVRVEFVAFRQQTATAVAAATSSAPRSTSHTDRLDDQALEVFSTTLGQVVSKANEIDTLKVQFELIKRKIKRLEEREHTPPALPASVPQHRRESTMIPSTATPSAPMQATNHHGVHSQHEQLSNRPQTHSPFLPEAVPNSVRRDVSSGSGAWAPVNSGVKRSAADFEGLPAPVESPKRAKIAGDEAQIRYEAQAQTAARHEHAVPADFHPPAQQASPASYPDATNLSNFVPYTQDRNPDDSWRPTSQVADFQVTATSPRGRGRGRGRAGRPRKHLPMETHVQYGTPEWEKEGWTLPPSDADGFYRGQVIMRRGSGGYAPGLGLSSSQSVFDLYSHTKKSRTRPTRNADGVLIRKDGRPDMRSQSSAANLRKVHSKREEERAGYPSSSLAGEPLTVADSPASIDSQDQESTDTKERTEQAMKQMFPHGVELDRARLYTAQRHFPNRASAEEDTPSQSVSDSEKTGSHVEPERPREDSAQVPDSNAALTDDTGEPLPSPSSENTALRRTSIGHDSVKLKMEKPNSPSATTIASTIIPLSAERSA